jgi:hypothetical protein
LALVGTFGVQAVYWGMAGFAAFGATGMGIGSVVGKEGGGLSLEDMVDRPKLLQTQWDAWRVGAMIGLGIHHSSRQKE